MDWTSFLAGILAGGVIAGSMAFLLGVAVGGLVGQREDRLSKLVDQLNTGEHIVLSKDGNNDGGDEDIVDAMDGLDFMLDESKREN